MISEKVVLEIKTSRDNEDTPESMVRVLESFAHMRHKHRWFFTKGVPISLEIGVLNQQIHFFVVVPQEYQDFVTSQIVAHYPRAFLTKVKDPLASLTEGSIEEKRPIYAMAHIRLTRGPFLPIKTYADFPEADPLAAVVGFLAKTTPQQQFWIQILLVPAGQNWQKRAAASLRRKNDPTQPVVHDPLSQVYEKLVAQKITQAGFSVDIRLFAKDVSVEQSKSLLSQLGHTFHGFGYPGGGNSFKIVYPAVWQKKKFVRALSNRSEEYVSHTNILNCAEIATLFHLPSSKLAMMPNIAWHKTLISEPPDNLPIAEGLTDEQKKEINFFGRTQFKNTLATFGIKKDDRRRHMYVIGKTGTGKSTLIANLVISDIRNGRGVCVVDPHGDLCEKILEFIPSFRLNDIVYLDPADRDYMFHINPLEASTPEQREFVVSGLVSIFKKMYEFSWGPRLEYILRNVLLTLVEVPNSTLLDVPRILTDEKYRERILTQVQDPVMLRFWKYEFAEMNDRQMTEAIAPILNKVGQFISSPLMRRIVSSPYSTVNLEKLMEQGKIILVNVSQGKLGEDNASLLGAMIITKLQLAAMNRVHVPEHERTDFYLYVDEFQNFATSSFVKILSEARKYRLCLILANQYIGQIPEDVRSAIFGNAGTLLTFLVGAEDAKFLVREFGERFKEDDLLALDNYQAIVKLAIDGITRAPFVAQTLPLPNSRTQNREKAIRNSRDRYTRLVQKPESDVKRQEE